MLLSKKQTEFVRNAKGHRWTFKGGATRSGKTYLDFKWIIPSRIRERVGLDGLVFIVGVTQSTVERNVLEPMRVIYGGRLVGQIRHDNTVMLFGQVCYVLGAEKKSQVSKFRGSSAKYIYGDEVADWNEDVFNLLKSRLDCDYSCFDGTFNPQSPNHWLKAFLDSDADIYSQTYSIDDNPFLPKKFVADLKKEYAGTVFYDRYILGLWTKAEGLIYQEYEEALEARYDGAWLDYCISCDYGTLNAFAALKWVCGVDGAWHCVDEYYYSGRDTGRHKTDRQYLEDMLKFANDAPSGKVEIIVDPSAASFITELRESGRFRVRKAKNNVIDGIRHTATCIELERIKVGVNCANLVDELAGYVWDDKREDAPVKDRDHACDAMRYFCETKRLVKSTQGDNTYVSIFENHNESRRIEL